MPIWKRQVKGLGVDGYLDQMEALSGRIPNARLLKIAGGSDAFFMEKRRRFNREVLDFLVNS